MAKYVEIEGGGFVEFPDDMDDASILDALRKAYAPSQPVPGMEKLGALPGVPGPAVPMHNTSWRQGLPDAARIPLAALQSVGQGAAAIPLGLLDAAEAVTGIKQFGAPSRWLREETEKVGGGYVNPEAKAGSSVEGTLNTIASGAGSSVGFMLPAAGVARLTGALGRLQALSPAARALSQVAAGTAAGTGLETVVDAGAAFREVLEETGDEQLARQVAASTALREFPTTLATNAAEMLLPGLDRRVTRGAFGAILEGAQEVAQGEAQRSARSAYGLDNGDVSQARLEDFIGGAGGGALSALMFGGSRGGDQPAPSPAPAVLTPQPGQNPPRRLKRTPRQQAASVPDAPIGTLEAMSPQGDAQTDSQRTEDAPRLGQQAAAPPLPDPLAPISYAGEPQEIDYTPPSPPQQAEAEADPIRERIVRSIAQEENTSIELQEIPNTENPFMVAVRDNDSGELLPSQRLFPSEEEASAYIQGISGAIRTPAPEAPPAESLNPQVVESGKLALAAASSDTTPDRYEVSKGSDGRFTTRFYRGAQLVEETYQDSQEAAQSRVQKALGKQGKPNFRTVYLEKLRKAVQEKPDQYRYSLDEVEPTVDKMIEGLKRGTAGVSDALKSTAKALGIKPTKKAIQEYLLAEMSDADPGQTSRTAPERSVATSVGVQKPNDPPAPSASASRLGGTPAETQLGQLPTVSSLPAKLATDPSKRAEGAASKEMLTSAADDAELRARSVDQAVWSILAKPKDDLTLPEYFATDGNFSESELNSALASLVHRGLVERNGNTFRRRPGTKLSAVANPMTKSEPAAEPVQPPAVSAKPTSKEEPTDGRIQPGEARSVGAEDSAPLEAVSPEDDRRPGGNRRPAKSGLRGAGTDAASADRPLEAGDRPPAGPGVDKGAVGVSPRRGDDARPKPKPKGVDQPRSGRDYRLADEDLADLGGESGRWDSNMDAIELVRQLENEGRVPTKEEQRKLARYVGWGALSKAFSYSCDAPTKRRQERLRALLSEDEYRQASSSTKNAHYTTPAVIRGMWRALKRMGVKRSGLRYLEPATGVGSFLGLQPEELLPAFRFGSEMDSVTARIAKALYPDANIIHSPYQDAGFPNNYFDVAISNVPFGKIAVNDPSLRKSPALLNGIHNYFFGKALEQVKPGGIVAFVTSRYTLDAKNSAVRSTLADKADLVGAIRLPGGKKGAFAGNAGTDVTTDIIFLRKRRKGEKPQGEGWKNTVATPALKQDGSMGEAYINEYFARHPEMMLGEISLRGSMYREDEVVLEGELSEDAFQKAIDALPADIFNTAAEEGAPFDPIAAVTQDTRTIKKNGFGLAEGKLVLRTEAGVSEVSLNSKSRDRIVGMMGIRDVLRDYYGAQLTGQPDAAIDEKRKELNKLYDAFVKTNGPINDTANRRAYGEDPDYAFIAALEDYDAEAKKAVKREVFTKRTISQYKPAESARDAKDALSITLAERGRLDLNRMSQLLAGRPVEEIVEELGDQVYEDPGTGEIVLGDEYLSGNVVRKLKDARAAAKVEKRFERHVAALEKVQPKPLVAEEISVRMGAPWIETNEIQSFLVELLSLEKYGTAQGLEIQKSEVTGIWNIVMPEAAKKTSINSKFNPNFYVHELVQLALNGQKPKVYGKDAQGNSFLDAKATAAAEDAQDRVTKEFTKWLWRDPKRKEGLVTRYNDEFNNMRLWEPDGSHLQFPGMAKQILRGGDLDAHQKNAVWRIIRNGNTLLAHVVGAGKTFEMIAAGMEMKRMGLANKPMYVVPNHLVEQWGQDFLRLYPQAKVLVAGKETFAAGKRQQTAAKIASGNYDAVIVSHKSFEFLPLSRDTFAAFVERETAEIRAELENLSTARAKTKGRTVKSLETRLESLQARLASREKLFAKDNTVTFEETGVDFLFVDEAHLYKNLGYASSMERIAGLPNTDSARAFDMFTKTQYLNERSGGRSIVFATGTPVANSLAEMWTMQRYLDLPGLRAQGLHNFDSWANLFGQAERGVELAPEGGKFRMNTRFVRFVNIPELITKFRSVADVKNADDLKLPKPSLRGGKPTSVSVPGSPALVAFVKSLGRRADRIRSGQVDPSEDNMLKITHEGRTAALDIRLMRKEVMEAVADVKGEVVSAANRVKYLEASRSEKPEDEKKRQADLRQAKKDLAETAELFEALKPIAADPTLIDRIPGKLHTAASRIAEIYHRTAKQQSTQVVFLDLGIPKKDTAAGEGEEAGKPEETSDVEPMEGSAYDELKKLLMANGVLAEDIRYIHEAKTDAQKKKLFDQVNAGAVRVVLGSTEKMGAGTNIQKKLIALHHIDVPWRPADIEQRNGRILRQGNENAEVEVFQYATEGSFDGYMWQGIATKAKMIGAAMSGDLSLREIPDTSTQVISAKEMMALASGNPLVQERIETEAKVLKLRRQRASHLEAEREQSLNIQRSAAKVEKARSVLSLAEKVQRRALEWRESNPEAKPIQLDGFEEANAENLQAAFEAIPHRGEEFRAIGSAGPFRILARYEVFWKRYHVEFEGTDFESWYQISQGSWPSFLGSLTRAFGQQLTRSDDAAAQLEFLQKDLAVQRERKAAEWEGEAELASLEKRLDEVNTELGIYDGEAPSAEPDSKPQASGNVTKQSGSEVDTSEASTFAPSGFGALEILYRRAERWARNRNTRTPGTPIRKATVRRLLSAKKKADVPDTEYRRILEEVSGQDDTRGLTQEQAKEVLDRLMTASVPLFAAINSPSYVLSRSASGSKIYEAAEDAWFMQERINERWAKNWERVNRGTTKKERNRIAIYRFVSQIIEMRGEEEAASWLKEIGEDPGIARNPEAFLTEKEKRVNAAWTKFFFEPSRQLGVAEGVLEPNQRYTNYLSFYRENLLSKQTDKLKDAAADLAQELGLPISLAETILERATPKKVKFGSFDYEREAMSVPGMRDADLIAEVYRKGFARKVAITRFLNVANPLSKQIADPAVRDYARRYIKQYTGRPQGSAMLDAAIAAIPGLRKLGLSSASVAGWLTSVQFNAKIGFNLFTPMLNLTQTVLNTVPKAGLGTTLRVAPRAAAYVLLPKRINPFARDIARLKVGGIYSDDPAQSKFDRPVFHGAAEHVQKAASFLFDKAESFNRATAYLAGLELARREGLHGQDAVRKARSMVRMTQFYSGRLDAPLFARSPHGKIVMQFKTFTVKQLEFISELTPRQKVKFAFWTVLLGGPASLGIQQALNLFFPDDEITEMVNQWQESLNLAAVLQLNRLKYQMGLFTIPGMEDVGSGRLKERLATWAMGPSLTSIADLADRTVKLVRDPETFDKWAENFIRGWVPGGVQASRVNKAWSDAVSAEDAAQILVGAGKQ